MLKIIVIFSYILLFISTIIYKFIYGYLEPLVYFIASTILISILINICLIINKRCITIYIISLYNDINYLTKSMQKAMQKDFCHVTTLLGYRDLLSTAITINLLIKPALYYYKLDYIYNNIFLCIQVSIFIICIGSLLYINKKIKNL